MDVTIVGGIVRTEVAQIRMMFIVDYCDLNVDVFNDSTGFYVLHDYDPHGGYLKRLQSEVRNFISNLPSKFCRPNLENFL